jgi:hypothetical protein
LSREIGIIYARMNDDTIGINNRLPWLTLEHDMNNFKKTTQGNIIIMGKNTFESIGKKPLINRINIVVSKTLFSDILKNVNVVKNDLEEIQYDICIGSYGVCSLKNTRPFLKSDTQIYIVNTAKDAKIISDEFLERNVYYIGGKSIFEFGYKFCNTIYETIVNDIVKVASNNDHIVTYNVRQNNAALFDDVWNIISTTTIEPKYGPSYSIYKYTTDIISQSSKIY